MNYKEITKNEPVRYILIGDDEIRKEDILSLAEDFDYDSEEELRSYEIKACHSTLEVLKKHNLVKNWTGSRMADMYSITDEFIDMVNKIIDGDE